jgi:acyl-coenzyme A thioesterase PaaI-like protein
MVAAVRATDLAFNQALGIRDAPAGAEHLLELPFAPLVHNHLQTMHAAAQFALAEAASAECLQRHFGTALGEVFAVMRASEVQYRKPARSDLLAYGVPDEETLTRLVDQVTRRGRSLAVILIDLKDRGGTLTLHGKFEWFISRAPTTSA